MTAPTRRFARGPFAALLGLLLVASAGAQDKKDPDPKEQPKLPEYKWPTDINGKDLATVMKEMEDPDPIAREFAAMVLPGFGPPASKGAVSKLLLRRMVAEKDPGVRAAVYNAVAQISFEAEADNKEALRLLANAVDTGVPGGPTRLNAVQTIASFGPKGMPAITTLTGNAMNDPAYATRQSIARTLAHVGFDEQTGPNMKALVALADRLARDECAAVRMEALQGLVRLGPPWAEVRKPGAKGPPAIKVADAVTIAKYMKARVGDPAAKLNPLEKDRQVEIWARLVLMKFDPKEVNEDNLNAFVKYLTGTDVGTKAQALNALALLGEGSARKIDDIVKLIDSKDEHFEVQTAAINALGAIGAGAKPALPALRKLLEHHKKELPAKKDQEKQRTEYTIKLLEQVIKHVDESKPTSPAIGPAEPPVPPKKP